MKFNLKRPCANCPFRADKPELKGWLGAERAREIANYALRDGKTFQCHKTIGQPNQGSCCAGALQIEHQALERGKIQFGNQMFQIAERLGLYDKSQMDFESVPVFQTADEMADFHSNDL